MSSPPVIPVIDRDQGRGRGSALRIVLLVALALGLTAGLLGGALFAVRAYWPHARIEAEAPALARVSLAPLGEHVSSVRVVASNGRRIVVRLRANRLEPLSTIAASARLRVTVTVKRSGWLGWLVGGTEVAHAVIRTPAARVTSTFVYPEAGTPVRVHFSAPVRVVSVRVPDAEPRFLHLDQPRRVVSIDVASGRRHRRGDGARRRGAAAVGTTAVARPRQLVQRRPGTQGARAARPDDATRPLGADRPHVLTPGRGGPRGRETRGDPPHERRLARAERQHAGVPAERARVPARASGPPQASPGGPGDLRRRPGRRADAELAGATRLHPADRAAARRARLPAASLAAHGRDGRAHDGRAGRSRASSRRPASSSGASRRRRGH